MGSKKGGENTKKAAGNARKAEAAAQKQAAEDSRKAAEDDRQWQQGSKANAKKAEAEAKKADAARKKAERDALLATEEANQPSKPKGVGSKSAQKKSGAPPPSRGLDLSQLDSTQSAALSASGIENALDALEITASPDSTKVDRHPERRFKAAYAAFEARRLPEIDAEFPGLRKQQRIEKCRKEFEKSEENPFNKAHVAFDSSRDEIVLVKESERKKIEARLTTK